MLIWILQGMLMLALDTFNLFDHNSTFRVVVVTVVLAAVHSPVPLSDVARPD